MLFQIVPVLLLVFSPFFNLNATTQEEFQAAVNAYQQNQLDQAKDLFINAAQDHSWQFSAYYNLGNIASRQNQLGAALAYYTKALSIKPHDKDTMHNHQLMVQKLTGKRLINSKTTLFDVFRNEVLAKIHFLETLALTFILSLLFMWNLLQFLKRNRESPQQPGVLLILLGVIFAVSVTLTTTKLIDSYSQRAIVTLAKAELKSGPGETNATMLEIGEGSELTVNDKINQWIQVTAANGLTGWVAENQVMITSGGGPW